MEKEIVPDYREAIPESELANFSKLLEYRITITEQIKQLEQDKKSIDEEITATMTDAGAVKVTNAPLTGDPPIVTVATNGALNAVFTIADCGDPLVAAIVSGGGLKLELLQLVQETRARKTKLKMQG